MAVSMLRDVVTIQKIEGLGYVRAKREEQQARTSDAGTEIYKEAPSRKVSVFTIIILKRLA